MTATDINGVELKPGQLVLVGYSESDPELATIEEVFLDSPTLNEPGYWVDIRTDKGITGMMSYVLEVICDGIIVAPPTHWTHT